MKSPRLQLRCTLRRVHRLPLGQGRLEAETQSWKTQALGWEPAILSGLGEGRGGRVANRTRMLPVALEAVWGHHQTVPIWIPCPSMGYLLLFPAPWMGQLIPACPEFKGKDVSRVRAPASCAPLSAVALQIRVCGASGDDGAARLCKWEEGAELPRAAHFTAEMQRTKSSFLVSLGRIRI